MDRPHVLLVKTDSGAPSPVLDALRSVRAGITVVVTENKSHAVDYLEHEGEFSDRLSPDPDLIVVDASQPDGVADFLSCARSIKGSKACPIVALTSTKDKSILKGWYEAGIHSVLSSDPEELARSLDSISWYWLKHNSTPKLR